MRAVERVVADTQFDGPAARPVVVGEFKRAE
jgi:hypothetical protein